MSKASELNPIATAAVTEKPKAVIRATGEPPPAHLVALPVYSKEEREYSRSKNPGFDRMNWFQQQRALAYDQWAQDADYADDDPEAFFNGLMNNPEIERINKREQAFHQSLRDAHSRDISALDDAEAQALYMSIVESDPRFGYDDDYDGTKLFGAEAGTGRENLKRLLDIYTGVNPNGLYSREAQDWMKASDAQRYFHNKRERSIGRAALQIFDTPEEQIKWKEDEIMQRQDAVQFASLMATMSPRSQQYVLDSLKNGELDERTAKLLPTAELELATAAYRAAAPYTDAHWWLTQGGLQAWEVAKGTVKGSWRMLANVYNTTGGRNPYGSKQREAYESDQKRQLILEDAMRYKFNKDELTGLGSIAAGLLGTTPYMVAMSNPYTGTLAAMGMMNDARERMVLSGVEPEKAFWLSVPVGVAIAYIEKLQWDKYMGTGLSDLALRQLSIKSLGKALKRMDFRSAAGILKNETKETAITYLTETAEEVLQQITEDVGVQIGKGEFNARELVESAYETFIESSPTTLGFGLMRGTGVGSMVRRKFSRMSSLTTDWKEYSQALNEAKNILTEHEKRKMGVGVTTDPTASVTPAAEGEDTAGGESAAKPTEPPAPSAEDIAKKRDEAMEHLRDLWYGEKSSEARYRHLLDYGLTADQAAALDEFFKLDEAFGEDNPIYTELTGMTYHGTTKQVGADFEMLPKFMRSVKSVKKNDDGTFDVEMEIAPGVTVNISMDYKTREEMAELDKERITEQVKANFDKTNGEGSWDKLDDAWKSLFIQQSTPNGVTRVGNNLKIDGHDMSYDGIVYLAKKDGESGDKGANAFHMSHEMFHAATLIAENRGIISAEDAQKLAKVFGKSPRAGEVFDEEKAADAYARWLLGNYTDHTGVFGKIADFFGKILRVLFGENSRLSQENVFRLIERGDLKGISALSGIEVTKPTRVNAGVDGGEKEAVAAEAEPIVEAKAEDEKASKPAETKTSPSSSRITVSMDIPGVGKVWTSVEEVEVEDLILPGEDCYDPVLAQFENVTVADTYDGHPLVAGGGNVVMGAQRVEEARENGDKTIKIKRIRKIETRFSIETALGKLDNTLAAMSQGLEAPNGVQKQAGTFYPDAGEIISRYSIGRKAREDAINLIKRKRPDLAMTRDTSRSIDDMLLGESDSFVDRSEEEFDKTIEDIVDEIGSFNTPKEQKAALHWFIKGTIRLPEDAPKVTEALKYADRAKGKANTDALSYDSPMAMIEALHEFKPKAKAIDPDTVPQLSDKQTFSEGVTTYLVEDTREGQQAMRQIINTHWGEDANPWCLLHGDGKGNLSDGTNGSYNAWFYWERYNALPKRVAFKNGKLLAFMATDESYSDDEFIPTEENVPQEYVDEYYASEDSEYTDFSDWMLMEHPDKVMDLANEMVGDAKEQWWDRQDKSHDGIPLGNMPVPGDQFGRWTIFEIRDGEFKQIGGYIKGENGKEGFRQWYANGKLAKAVVDGDYLEWHENGELSKGIVGDLTITFLESGELAFVYDNETKNYVNYLEEGKTNIPDSPETIQSLKERAERIYREHSQKTRFSIEPYSLKGGEDYVAQFGNVLAADEIRKYLPGYDRLDYHTHVDRTNKYVGDVFRTTLDYLLATRRGAGNGRVVFLAGGNGAGKSTVASNTDKADFVIDSTLGNVDAARKQIQEVLDNGQLPVILFVYRDPFESIKGVVGRAEKGGHLVSPLSFANSHTRSAENVQLLAKEFGDKIDVTVFKNTKDGAVKITLDDLAKIQGADHERIRKEADRAFDEARERIDLARNRGSSFDRAEQSGTAGEELETRFSLISDVSGDAAEIAELPSERHMMEAVGTRFDAPIDSGAAVDGVDNTVTRFSVKAGIEGIGCLVEEDKESGDVIVWHPGGERRLTKDDPITVDEILKTKSAVSFLLKHAVGKTITKGDARKLAELYADIVNTSIGYIEDNGGNIHFLNAVWKWAGAEIFKSVKPNGDAQYSLSIDMTTICKKTEQLMNVVSAFQVINKRGATPTEMIQLYLATGEGVEYDKNGDIITDNNGVPVHGSDQAVRREYFQTPCPCCYVFSHWIRTGLLMETAYMAQRRFAKDLLVVSEVAAIREERDQLEKNTAEWKDADKRYEDASRKAATKMRKLLEAEQVWQEEHKSGIDQAKKTLDAAGALLDSIARQIAIEQMKPKKDRDQAKIDALSGRIAELSPIITDSYRLIAQSDYRGWLKSTVIRDLKAVKIYDDYMACPAEILFAYNRADELVVNYPAMARFRTSKGSAGGKAIETDAHNEFGEIISGLAGMKKNGKPYNPFAVGDEDGMKKAYDKALLFSARQRLRGGQRIFSWSDNLIKFGADMFWNFLQLQTLGASVQSYSKQLEGVELICAMGGYNNGSLIAYGKGYEECDENAEAGWDEEKGFYRSSPVKSPKDGKWYQLCYSKVQGINAEKLFELNNTYDKSGNIIVGMNENHITLNIAHHGIFFCIPWHASSLKAEFLEKMMELLREPLSGEKSQDHTKVQGDGILKEPKKPAPLGENPTPEEEVEYADALAEYNEKIGEWKKGAAKRFEITDFWSEIGAKYSKADRFGKALPSCFEVTVERGTLSESQKQYAELRRRILMGEATAKELQLAMKDVFLSQIIRKLERAAADLDKASGGSSDEVREVGGRRLLVMQKADAGSIYPYEYWDETSHYYHLDPATGAYVGTSTADCNGDRYLEYCRRMGAVPKFCGFQKNGTRFRATKSSAKAFGKNVGDVLMDYHEFEGYFKLLIDRRMYGIDGVYQDTTPVNASGMKMEHIRVEDLRRKWVDEKGRSLITTVADNDAAEPIARGVTYANKQMGLEYDSSDLGFNHDEAYLGAERATKLWKGIVKRDKEAAKADMKVVTAAKDAAKKTFEKNLGALPGKKKYGGKTKTSYSISLRGDPADLIAAIVANGKRTGKPIDEATVGRLLKGIGGNPNDAKNVMSTAASLADATNGRLKGLLDTKAVTDDQFLRVATDAAKQKRLLKMAERVGVYGYKLGREDERRAQELMDAKDKIAQDLIAAAEGFKADEMEAKYGFDIVGTVANAARAERVKPNKIEDPQDKPGEVNGEGVSLMDEEADTAEGNEPQEVEAPESEQVKAFKVQAQKRADEIDAHYGLAGGTSPAQARANKEQELLNTLGEAGGTAEETADNAEGGESDAFTVKRDKLDFNRASDFVAFIETIVEAELKSRGKLAEGEEPFVTPVNIRELVNTARHWLKKIAMNLCSSHGRELILEDIRSMERATTLQGAECAIMNCYARIKEKLITETQRQLVKKLKKEGRKLAEDGKRFKRGGDERSRKVHAEVEYWWRNIKRYFEMDAEAIQAELDELNKILEKREETIEAESGYKKENDREWVRANDLKNALVQFGGLINMKPAMIEQISEDILDQLRGSREELENAREDKRIEMQSISMRLQAAMKNPIAEKENRKPAPKWAARMFDSMIGVLHVRLRDLIRFSKGKVRTDAEADLQNIEDAIALASQGYNVYVIEQQDALAQFMEQHYGSPAEGVRRLTEVLDDEDRKLLTKQGVGEMTRSWLMQRYVELLQTDDYAVNIEINKRNGKWREDFDRIFKKYISSDDMKLIAWFRDWYRSNLDDVNNKVLVPISGIKQYSPSENYFPVKMKTKERQGFGAAAKTWSPYPNWLTPRVANTLDFDESTDILTLWYKRMREGGVSIHYAKLGVNLGDIFMTPEMKKCIADNHGDMALKRLKEHFMDIVGGGAKDIVNSDSSLEFADRLRAWQTNLTLSMNYVSAFKQMFGCPAFALRHDINLGMVMKFMADIDLGSIRELMASDGWTSRYGAGLSEAIQNAMRVNAESGGKPGLSGVLSSLYNSGYKMMEIGDSVPALWIGQGLYRYFTAKLRDEAGNTAKRSEEEIKEIALARTWAVIEMTQQSSRIENLSAAQRGGQLGRLLYQFLSSGVMQLSYEVQVIKEAYSQAQAYGGWANVDPETKKHLYRVLVINHILVPTLLNLAAILAGLPLGAIPDKDELIFGLLVSMVIGQYGCIFMAGAVGENTLNALLTGKYNYGAEGLPVTGIADLFTKLGVTAHDLLTLDTEDLQKDFIKLLQSTGAPARQAIKAYRNWGEGKNEKAIKSWTK